MMNFIPKISVLIPVYNVEKYIERCIRSLIANSIINDCEVIIVNDCSPDNSMSIVRHVLGEFPELAENFKLHSHDFNRGLAAARNTALLQAHGKYIICVDSDDWVESDYLEALYTCAEENNADVVMCDLLKETLDGSEQIIERKQSDNYVEDLLMGKIHGWLHEKLIKLSLIKENNIRWIEGLNMCEDLLLMTKVFYFAKKVIHLERVLYHYDCTNESSLTHSLNESKINQLINVVNEIEQVLPNTYIEAIKFRKSITKLWILLEADIVKDSYIKAYNTDALYKIKEQSKSARLFLFLCCLPVNWVVKLLIFLKKRLIKRSDVLKKGEKKILWGGGINT